jgi:hypothetical protein
MDAPLVERHSEQILGVLSCFDRVVITGTLPEICHAQAMSAHLRSRGFRIFDYTQFAEPFREEIRGHAERLAAESGLTIEFIQRKCFRKEDRIQEILRTRGENLGLVHIFSAMEPCSSFRPWHNKQTGQTYLRSTEAKCLHYYFYFILEDLGLCYLRVPTWAPFRLQFYYNGHNQLASQLRKAGIDFHLIDNAFVSIEDFEQAQRLSDGLRADVLHRTLDEVARWLCPVATQFKGGYHWSLMQLEYATDIVFRNPEDLKPLYEVMVRTAIHAVKPENVATFLGRKLDERSSAEVGNEFHTRIEGTRIKHHLGRNSIKMYDKLGRVLRIETTSNDVTSFKHHRRVEHRDGTWTMKNAQVRKTIYSLPDLQDLMRASNRRYLEFLSALDDPIDGIRNLERLSKSTHDGQRTHRGFNLFDGKDRAVFEAIVRGEFDISGFQNRHLQDLLPDKSAGQISRVLKRLRTHGLVKKIGRTYKYYVTQLGQRVICAALTVRRLILIPALAKEILT